MRKTQALRRAAAAGAAVACLTGPAAARADQDAVDRRAPLVGHVLDREGHGVRDVCISAVMVREGDQARTLSGKGGRFILDTTGWQSESYYVIRLWPCRLGLQVAPEYYRHADHSFAAYPVKVQPGHTTYQNFVLRREAVIEGTVTSALGRPLAGVCVLTRQWDDSTGDDDERDQAWSVTDDHGHYRLPQLTPGRHRVAAYQSCASPHSAWNVWMPPVADAGEIEVREGQTRHVELAVLSPP